jgi:hypothetical protein
VLTGIYSHTSAHIVAAPMAHHMAMNGSRFCYSHDSHYLPCHGVLQLLTDENMIMKFRMLHGKQVAYHSAMNYVFRPDETEELCLYQFYRDVEFSSQSKLEKEGRESFPFRDEHPMADVDALAYRKRPCVPVFRWTWIGSTKKFGSSLMSPVSKQDRDFQIKEEYTKRFMIVFLPFRKLSDLTVDGTHQACFQKAMRENRFSDEMLDIADNIQTIQNSIDSAIPENTLSAETDLVEAEDFPDDEVDVHVSHDEFLEGIADLYSSTPDGEKLTSETTSLNPDFGKSELQRDKFKWEEPVLEEGVGLPRKEVLVSVIEFAESAEVLPSAKQSDEQSSNRHFSTTSELNSVFIRQHIIANNLNNSEEVGGDDVPVIVVDATGSWQSVVSWGENAGLDTEQQIGFEILAATYVLTFYEEAEGSNCQEEEFRNRINLLRKLARRDEKQITPLRLFVTGPAGAGKCTLRFVWGERRELHFPELTLHFLFCFVLFFLLLVSQIAG